MIYSDFRFDMRSRCYDDIVFLFFSVTNSLRRSPVTDFHFRFEHPNGTLRENIDATEIRNTEILH